MQDAGDHVTHTAANQAKDVAGEACQQARNLHEGVASSCVSKAVSGQQQAARKLITIADELREIAGGRTTSSTVNELTNQGASQLQREQGLIPRSPSTSWLAGRARSLLSHDRRAP
jgi:hypothetical protein